MRAAPGRASAAPRMIARLSRQIGIASLNMTGETLDSGPFGRQTVAEFDEFRVKRYLGPPVF
jgi:hypothetical protein